MFGVEQDVGADFSPHEATLLRPNCRALRPRLCAVGSMLCASVLGAQQLL